MKIDKGWLSAGRYLICGAAMAAAALTAAADADDFLYVTTSVPDAYKVLSRDPNSPTLLFQGNYLDDYEPAYASFAANGRNGQCYYVKDELADEILRPYNVVRTGSGSDATVTVQFQGVTRTHFRPHTACVVVKFVQTADGISAYTVSASSLKPHDIELGLDMTAGGDRIEPEAIQPDAQNERCYSLNIFAMRKRTAAAAATTYEVSLGDVIAGEIDGVGPVSVVSAPPSPSDTATYSGYLPNNSYVVVAENHSLADLDEVEGTYHYGPNQDLRQTPYQFKYTSLTNELGRKTCQFQRVKGKYITCVKVRFRQNGANVEAETDQWANYYMDTTGYESEVYLGMDFEKYVRGGTPDRCCYNSLASSDEENSCGVKDLVLKFRKRASTTYNAYLPNGYDAGIPQSWTVVATNRSLSELKSVEAFYHTGANDGIYAPGLHLAISGTKGSCQFQRTMSGFIKCVCVDLRDNGGNIEASTGRYRNFHIYYDGRTAWNAPTGTINPDVVYGMDFYAYDGNTTPPRFTYGGFGTSDSSASEGVKELRLTFKTDGIVYAARQIAPLGGDLTFVGSSADAPLAAWTTSATVLPSNGVVTVGPYAELTLNGHVQNPKWTQYRVMTNGTLRLNGTWQTSHYDPIDLVGGTLRLRDLEDDATSAQTYVNFLTLMDGARVLGKPARVGPQTFVRPGSWIVSGDSPSYCESGIVVTGRGGDQEQTFCFNVNDVTGDEAADFVVSGDIVDYGTFQPSDENWNVHVVKDGAGTLQIAGVTLPNELAVSNGTLRISGNCTFGVSRKRAATSENTKAEIVLAGGDLEVAEASTNAIGVVKVKHADEYGTPEWVPLTLRDGSSLTMDGIEFDSGMALRVSTNLGKTASLRIIDLPESKRIRIRCGEGDDEMRVRNNSSGWLVPFKPGLCIVVQ